MTDEDSVGEKRVSDGPTLTAVEALVALNELRSNIVATQSASWSNVAYPLVAILNAAGFEQFDSTKEQKREHLECYGGAGGFPGHLHDPERYAARRANQKAAGAE